ncbi:MAG: NAD(P)-binding domain-containing protein, partial [Rectinemataceae bacterium]|nr:NAD(P)-binding domain-containing protein [Rectinemataceae bacterium]
MSPEKDVLGFIGLGVMGVSMAGHLLKAGYTVRVFTRTKVKAAGLIDTGAVWMDTPGAVARGCSVVFTMVGYPSDVEEVYFGTDGIIGNALPGTVFVDMTTSSPDLAVRISGAAKAAGLGALDAPVSGGDIGAKNATLSIMVGGDGEDFEKVKPLFELMGK